MRSWTHAALATFALAALPPLARADDLPGPVPRGTTDRAIVAPRVVAPAALADSTAYASTVATGNQVGVTLTNWGFVGNNFVNRSPSLEYPLGSGIEHLPRGGLWIGGRSTDSLGAFTGVSAAVLDGSTGFSTTEGSEFTPAGTSIALRSRVTTSPWYDPKAVSMLDYVTTFSDYPEKATTASLEDHRPLGVLVRQSVYTWNWTSLDDVVFLRYHIRNISKKALSGIWVGFYAELMSGDRNAYTCWPPRSTCAPSGYGGWYAKAWLQYDASLRLLREHYCGGLPVPGGCLMHRAPYWMGVQLLTPPALGQKVTVAAWRWEPLAVERDQDVERYALMTAGKIQNLDDPDLTPLTGDPVELIAVGPFPAMLPGDSVVVDFALVGGAEVADIQANAAKAQSHHDFGFVALRPVGVEPPDAPDAAGLAIAGLDPNPSRGATLSVRFSAPRPGPATFELVDIAGRVVARQRWSLEAGARRMTLPGTAGIPPGVYLARLTQAGARAEARVVVTR
jgi:hypothetical protein